MVTFSVGLRPSPFSIDIVSASLSILQTLSVGNFTVCENMVDQWSAVNVLTELALVCPEEYICSKVMTALSHINLCR